MKKTTSTVMVYSTDHGRICLDCGKPVDSCSCGQKKIVSPGNGVVRIRREAKGRKGKGVTIITGVPLDPSGLQALVKELKMHCGCGGTVKEGVIEIQGDHRALLLTELSKRWKAKLCGE
jgi:translation initiation factor 1